MSVRQFQYFPYLDDDVNHSLLQGRFVAYRFAVAATLVRLYGDGKCVRVLGFEMRGNEGSLSTKKTRVGLVK